MMRAIETHYRGYRFRSRLEARWAVFFQTLGVRWEYEPEGFVLSTGEYYLPDFRISLRDGPLWVEVKPHGASTELFETFLGVNQPGDEPPETLGTVLHEIPDPEDIANGDFVDDDFSIFWDIHYQFCTCNACGTIGFQYCGRSERIGCGCHTVENKIYTYDHPRILNAYAAARSARFEHRENGRRRWV